MSKHKPLEREEYIEQIKSISTAQIPDFKFVKIRNILYDVFIKQLPVTTYPEYSPYVLPDEHIRAKEVEKVYEEYNNLAIHYANSYRGGYLLNYLGFALAVTVAALAFTLLYYSKYIPDHYQWIVQVLLLILGLVKLWVIITIVYNTDDLQKNRINQKHIDFRYVAERLRFDVTYAILGMSCQLTPKIGHHLASELKQSTGEILYQHVLATRLNNLSTQLGTNIEATALAYLPNDQKNFHANRAERHERYDDFLQQRAGKMNNAVIGLVVFDIVVALSYLLCHACQVKLQLVEMLHLCTAGIIALTIVLPAWVAAHVAITAQSEYRRLALRNKRLLKELKTSLNEIEKQWSQTAFDETAQKLIDEVTEWTLIYEKRVYEM